MELTENNRAEVIEHYASRIITQVNRYILKNPAHRPHEDDIIGECLLKLVEVVDLVLVKKIDNFEGYLHQSIKRAIASTLRDTSLIKTRAKNHPVIVFGGTSKATARPLPELTYNEAFNGLLHTIKDVRDATIFQLRWAGMDVTTVAAKMGVSRQTVVRRLKRMKTRYAKTAQDELGVD